VAKGASRPAHAHVLGIVQPTTHKCSTSFSHAIPQGRRAKVFETLPKTPVQWMHYSTRTTGNRAVPLIKECNRIHTTRRSGFTAQYQSCRAVVPISNDVHERQSCMRTQEICRQRTSGTLKAGTHSLAERLPQFLEHTIIDTNSPK